MDKAREICVEMLEQRGYELLEDDQERIIFVKPDGNQVVAFFSDLPKFNVKNIQVYIAIMNELEIFHAVIVYKDGVTAFTKKAVDQSLEMRFELFAVENLQYNITKHRLQPKFERLEEKEAENFKKEFGIRFGTMRNDDPIALFYDYNKGDVIRITRDNSGNKSITYRIVKG